MEFKTPRCSQCHQTSDRTPIREVGVIGEHVVSEARKGKPAVVLPLVLYQCTGCRAVFLVLGRLKPTSSPLDEIPGTLVLPAKKAPDEEKKDA
jgi:hypothetical protein